MNDFTKEELENIKEAVEWWFKDLDADWPERLYLKIQSMIDNYCEHEETNHSYASVYQCVKCGRLK